MPRHPLFTPLEILLQAAFYKNQQRFSKHGTLKGSTIKQRTKSVAKYAASHTKHIFGYDTKETELLK